MLDKIQLLEVGGAGNYAIETFVNCGFLQAFVWEHVRGLDVTSMSYKEVKFFLRGPANLYTPKLLDDVDNFVFRPFINIPDKFLSALFCVDGESDLALSSNPSNVKDREALLNMAGFSLPTFSDDNKEILVKYSPHRAC